MANIWKNKKIISNMEVTMTGSPYWLQIYENNRWDKVEYIPQEHNISWIGLR